MFATTLGVEFNAEADWNEREEVFTMSDKIVRTFNVTQTAKGNKTGLWKTVIAAAILLPLDKYLITFLKRGNYGKLLYRS
jgi:arginine decarboxylase